MIITTEIADFNPNNMSWLIKLLKNNKWNSKKKWKIVIRPNKVSIFPRKFHSLRINLDVQLCIWVCLMDSVTLYYTLWVNTQRNYKCNQWKTLLSSPLGFVSKLFRNLLIWEAITFTSMHTYIFKLPRKITYLTLLQVRVIY